MAETSNDNKFSQPLQKNRWQELWLLPAAFAAMVAGWQVANSGLATLAMLVMLPLSVGFVVLVLLKPRIGFLVFVVYCFAMPGLGRHLPGQLGLLFDGLLLLVWLSVLFWRTNRFHWRHLNNELVWMAVAWLALSVLELGNPSRPHPQGWLQEVRGIALYWLMLTPLVFFVFNQRKDLGFFLNIIICLSLLGAIYGVKQLHIGLDGAEQAWLESGAKRTHMLFGKLRVFSFYFEAAQFGASQGQLAITCFILAAGPYAFRWKAWYLVAGLVIFYGMLISGTRGAMGALAGGGMLFLVLSRNIRLIVIGGVVGFLFFSFLKFTTIANGNDQIRRLRTSTNANDPSLQLRLYNQKRLSEHLKSRPFGTGVGTIGMWGVKFNKHIPTAGIAPDSMYVKIWVQYGIFGFIVWLGMMLYITGKSIGIAWKTRDPVLRNQLTALAAGSFGALVCSYGNEVMNQMPTSMIVYVSWAIIWMSPRWDRAQAGEGSLRAKSTALVPATKAIKSELM